MIKKILVLFTICVLRIFLGFWIVFFDLIKSPIPWVGFGII